MFPQTPPFTICFCFQRQKAEESLTKTTFSNKIFKSVFKLSWQIRNSEEPSSSAFDKISVTENRILNCLQARPMGKSREKDNIANVFLKNATVLSKSLLLLYQTCFNKGKLPTAWKTSVVVPLHKHGNKKNRNLSPNQSTDDCPNDI